MLCVCILIYLFCMYAFQSIWAGDAEEEHWDSGGWVPRHTHH